MHLALSLHAAQQSTRLRLVPSSSAYTVERIMRGVDEFVTRSGRSVMAEYILIRGVNDTPEEAHALGVLLEGRNVQVNLIPYNRTAVGDELGYASPSHDEVLAFAAALKPFATACSRALC